VRPFIKRFCTSSISLFVLVGLGFPTFAKPVLIQETSKQIVFLIGDADKEFISVSISGYNQNGEWSTWTHEDLLGFSMAYTKDWWWTQNFVQISFTYRDQFGYVTTDSCLIDALEQPTDSPRVEIIYQAGRGCIGGETGSAVDPVLVALKPVKDAFNTVDYYLSDFDFDVFMKTVYVEANVAVCVVAVGTAFHTGGLSLALATPFVTRGCHTTGQEVLKLFTQP
jgi:hypothetical protein